MWLWGKSVFTGAGVAEAGTPSSSSVETSVVQSGPSAGATSLPAEVVGIGHQSVGWTAVCVRALEE